MLTDQDLASFRSRLANDLARLDGEDRLGRMGEGTVTLDQQSVGRLSRMDALQQQAMAQATHRRRDAQRRKIAAALERLAEGDYGYCTDCGEEIDRARLELDAATPKCLGCAKG